MRTERCDGVRTRMKSNALKSENVIEYNYSFKVHTQWHIQGGGGGGGGLQTRNE